MVGGDFQKSLQLFIAYGYCVFEDDVCVDLSSALDERPNYVNITFSELFARRCVDRPGVMDEGPDYATCRPQKTMFIYLFIIIILILLFYCFLI